MTDRHWIWGELDGLQHDLRAMNAKVTSIRSFISQLTLPQPEPVKCSNCDYTSTSRHELEQHEYHHHEGPLPTLWRIADERSAA